jgi:hypothetical protein
LRLEAAVAELEAAVVRLEVAVSEIKACWQQLWQRQWRQV